MTYSDNTGTSTVVPSPKSKIATSIEASFAQVESVFSVDRKTKTEIDVSEGMHIIVDKCIAELAKTELVFERGSILMCIDHDNSVHTFTKSTVKFALSKLVSFVKSTYNIKSKQIEMQTANIPDYVGDTLISLTKWKGMPVIDALTDHPIISFDNRLLKPGYDSKTRVFSRFDASQYDVPGQPNKDDAIQALVYVQRLLQTFEFEAPEDESAALALFLTAVCRPVIPTALMTLINASMSGSGKGYLATLACLLAKFTDPVARQHQNDEAEMNKALMSVLIAASPVCFFDELSMNDIDMPCLRTFTSAPVFGGRYLGYMREVQFTNRTFVSATGNNVAPTGDMSRRMLLLTLNPQCENPALRRFEYFCDDPEIKTANADIKANRNIFISKILTIQRAFLIAQEKGETIQTESTLGGFDEWEQLCRLPILWLTGIDPAKKSIDGQKENAQKDELGIIMTSPGVRLVVASKI